MTYFVDCCLDLNFEFEKQTKKKAGSKILAISGFSVADKLTYDLIACHDQSSISDF